VRTSWGLEAKNLTPLGVGFLRNKGGGGRGLPHKKSKKKKKKKKKPGFQGKARAFERESSEENAKRGKKTEEGGTACSAAVYGGLPKYLEGQGPR